ncbi:hypothetical protein ACLB1G_10425 [Oxalobacteraceae bacterium A2-2]
MKLTAVLLGMAACATLPAWAQNTLVCDRSYGIRIDVGGTKGATLCGSKVDDFLDGLDNFNLSNASYTQTSAASLQARMNDISILFSYDANSTRLKYSFPELGLSGAFTGLTRDDSEQQFVDYIKKTDILGRIIHYQAMHSATSPITGVGGSIPVAGQTDFDTSFDTASQIASPQGAAAGASGGNNNLVGVGIGYGSYQVDGSGDKVKTTLIPLTYTIRNDIDPRRQLVLSVPLTVVKVGDAISVNGGFGLAYRLPVSDRWSLTPGVKYSLVASRDRATVSSVMSASLMSTYVVPLGGPALAIGNMLGYYRTGKFSSGDYSFDPDVKLTMTRNGLMYSTPTDAFGGKMALEWSLIDTRYVGDKPFLDSSQELGVTLGTNRAAGNARSYTRAGLNYFRSKSTRGVNVNVGYWF